MDLINNDDDRQYQSIVRNLEIIVISAKDLCDQNKFFFFPLPSDLLPKQYSVIYDNFAITMKTDRYYRYYLCCRLGLYRGFFISHF